MHAEALRQFSARQLGSGGKIQHWGLLAGKGFSFG
jgi:hypothetical protein